MPGKQDVSRRDIAMGEPFGVQVSQRLGDGGQHGDRLPHRESAAAANQFCQGAAGGIVQKQANPGAEGFAGPSLYRLPREPEGIVRLDQMLVVQHREDPDLTADVFLLGRFGNQGGATARSGPAAKAFQRKLLAGPFLGDQPHR
ncbi:MAG: hypothetical protein NVS1B16_12210 [Pseudarthrobacter sp.]